MNFLKTSCPRHLFIYLFTTHHLYSCYHLRMPNKRMILFFLALAIQCDVRWEWWVFVLPFSVAQRLKYTDEETKKIVCVRSLDVGFFAKQQPKFIILNDAMQQIDSTKNYTQSWKRKLGSFANDKVNWCSILQRMRIEINDTMSCNMPFYVDNYKRRQLPNKMAFARRKLYYTPNQFAPMFMQIVAFSIERKKENTMSVCCEQI